jgi:kynurenine formamidase
VNLWDVYNTHLKKATFTDLTHEFFPGQPKFPALPDQEFSQFLKLSDGMLFEIHKFTFVGQWGTHVDAPLHMIAAGASVPELPVTQMLLPLVVLNIVEQAKADPDYCPTVADVEAWEAEHGKIPAGSFVALRADWDKRWPDQTKMDNKDSSGVNHFPGWSMDVLHLLFEDRNIAAVGHETTDTDGGVACSTPDSNWSLEKYVLSKGWQLELLTNLDKVPEAGALLMAMWPKPKGASGFPARAVAIH